MKVKKWIWIIAGVIVFIFIVSLFIINKNGDYDIFSVQTTDFTEIVEISGKVVPAQDLDLSFENIGRISKINVDIGDVVKEGDVLVELDMSEINSELNEVISNLEKEKASLSEISGNAGDQNKLENASENLIETIKKTYVTSDDIIRNVVDVFFDEPDSAIPNFTPALRGYFLRQTIGDKRKEIGGMLSVWGDSVGSLTINNLNNQDITQSISNLKLLEDFLSLLSSKVDDYKPTNSVTQTQIDSYISNISSARKSITSLIIEIVAANDRYRGVLAEIPVVQSTISSAEASVQKLSAKKNKYFLRAPFDGIITEQDIESGQIVSSGEKVLSMISSSSFEVEGFVSELNIIRINVGDTATLKFDAFGPDTNFKAYLSHVDPSETVKDGITTYRVLLNFKDFDPEIRSGMTVDIIIEKDKIENQIVIPRYLIENDEKGNYVVVEKNGQGEKVYIEIGRVDGRGGVIVNSGLNVGDRLIIEK